jgi:alkanesulfonate monooxygenase SsuD/methylene tetrahydromethanopterin reductase-like flavin-dependent oxidoreductase (luciferase family)
MKFDVFCSLAQTPRRDGALPAHAQVLSEFLDQAVAADELGYKCVWVAESHFSSELQKRHKQPVIPQWRGEVGLNTDVCQLAPQVFRRTRRIEVGSAITNILANGGPVTAAEKVATALAWHGLSGENRRLHIGFGAGRFDYIGRTTGIRPRTDWESTAWPQVKNAMMWEAGEVFVRLMHGAELSSEDVPERVLTPAQFRDRADFDRVAELAGVRGDTIPVPRRWSFEVTRIVPDFRPGLLQLVAGTHDPDLQAYLNTFAPVRVFNLSITPPEVIEQTHERMRSSYHRAGGPWTREYMPRTVFVFLNADPALSREKRRMRAREHAEAVLAEYWRALSGTIDPAKVASSADNSLFGAPEDIAEQIVTRFHPQDRLMLWFDFFAENLDDVTTAMAAFIDQVVPLLRDQGIPTAL